MASIIHNKLKTINRMRATITLMMDGLMAERPDLVEHNR
jgi:hypothetical protein